LTLNVALTTVLRTNVLHCDDTDFDCWFCKQRIILITCRMLVTSTENKYKRFYFSAGLRRNPATLLQIPRSLGGGHRHLSIVALIRRISSTTIVYTHNDARHRVVSCFCFLVCVCVWIFPTAILQLGYTRLVKFGLLKRDEQQVKSTLCSEKNTHSHFLSYLHE